MSENNPNTVPIPETSQSDIDEIENLITASVQLAPSTIQPVRPPSPTPPPPPPSIPVSTTPYVPPILPPPQPKPAFVPAAPHQPSNINANANAGPKPVIPPRSNMTGFGPAQNTLTEPVWETVKRDVMRIVSNLKLVVFPNPYREDPGKAMRDWDLWGPFFFIVFLGLTLSWSASIEKVTITTKQISIVLFVT